MIYNYVYRMLCDAISGLFIVYHNHLFKGLSCGIALIMYGRREEANVLIDQLLNDKVRW